MYCFFLIPLTADIQVTFTHLTSGVLNMSIAIHRSVAKVLSVDRMKRKTQTSAYHLSRHLIDLQGRHCHNHGNCHTVYSSDHESARVWGRGGTGSAYGRGCLHALCRLFTIWHCTKCTQLPFGGGQQADMGASDWPEGKPHSQNFCGIV